MPCREPPSRPWITLATIPRSVNEALRRPSARTRTAFGPNGRRHILDLSPRAGGSGWAEWASPQLRPP